MRTRSTKPHDPEAKPKPKKPRVEKPTPESTTGGSSTAAIEVSDTEASDDEEANKCEHYYPGEHLWDSQMIYLSKMFQDVAGHPFGISKVKQDLRARPWKTFVTQCIKDEAKRDPTWQAYFVNSANTGPRIPPTYHTPFD